MTMEASQFDRGKVTRPPSPGTLPVKSRTMRRNVGSCRVVVKDTHLDWSMWSVKTLGRPNAGRSLARFFHSEVQAPPSVLPLRAGDAVHAAQRRALGHRAQGHQHEVAVADPELARLSVLVGEDARDALLASCPTSPRSVHPGVEREDDTALVEPLAQRQHMESYWL